MRAVVIAGATSGVGKTTIATGVMGALARRGLKVQPFKTGPDYIDPSYHTWAAGAPSRNLDTWMLPHQAVVELFRRAASDRDIAVVEGVMGLFDGHSATNDEGSTAELAKLLGAPVLLVIDARKAARSVAALAQGFLTFDPKVRIGGVILNGIGGEGHLKFCREAIEHYTGIKVVGYLPRREDLSLPERHLGLVPTAEGPAGSAFLDKLIAQCEATLDIEAIVRLAADARVPEAEMSLFPSETKDKVARIAIARDKAFSFYYQDSLDLLEAWGAELRPFSPLEDRALPEGISGVYIGGGFPEMYAAELAGNVPMNNAVCRAAQQGTPVYAECGGLMYLSQGIRDLEGREHAMTGVIPLSCQIDKPKLSLGYRTIEALADGPVLGKGESVRGHEFHWSVLRGEAEAQNAYSVLEQQGRVEGFQAGNVLASYIHLHFGSKAGMAQRLVECCRKWRGQGR